MNNFKKFAAVLLGVVMACVFATSAFAADFNKSNNAKRAKDEILSFAASYGVTTIDNTVNKLTADQLNVIYANMDSLKAVAANAANTIKGTTDANVALKGCQRRCGLHEQHAECCRYRHLQPDARYQRLFPVRCQC